MDVAALDQLKIVLDPLGQAGIALALVCIMFSIALGLELRDFLYLTQCPTLFFGGVIAQVLALPLLTWAIIFVLQPPPSIALGLFVVACCPGGAVSNLLTYLAHGNVAYSVSLTATSSALAAVLTPAMIVFWSSVYGPTAALLDSIAFRPGPFLLQTGLLLAVPLLAGMLVAVRRPLLAARLQKPFAMAGSLVLAAAIVYGTVRFFGLLLPALPGLLALTALHNGLAFATGYLSGILLHADIATRRALTFEIGIQNSGLAIVILLAQFDGLGAAASVAVTWGVWHLVAGSILTGVFRRYDI